VSDKAISIVIMQYVEVRSKRITIFFLLRLEIKSTYDKHKLWNSNFQAIFTSFLNTVLRQCKQALLLW
jgi:hypothetical protein